MALRHIYFQGTFSVVERVPPQGAPTRWEPKGTKRQTHGLSSVPRNIKEEIGSLVYKLDQSKGSDDLAPPPGLWPSADVP